MVNHRGYLIHFRSEFLVALYGSARFSRASYSFSGVSRQFSSWDEASGS
jgi:hypothetical protein